MLETIRALIVLLSAPIAHNAQALGCFLLPRVVALTDLVPFLALASSVAQIRIL